MLSLNVLRYGADEPHPQPVPLQAGPLSLLWDDGSLRYIRLGEQEVVRRIYVAVRDPAWNTIPATLANVQITRAAAGFTIEFDMEHRQGPVDFAWHGTITGTASGTITFSLDGRARSTFRRNRIGFCVLHPPRECAGQPCAVEHSDGAVEQGVFPRLVAPHQPFFDMRAISHELRPGLTAEVRFTGDTFEMEDQRNWTDDSYKTYCTPLALPKPVEAPAGTVVRQTVTLTLRGDVPAAPAAEAPSHVSAVTVGAEPGGHLPQLGLGIASHGQPLSEREQALLRALRLHHLRVDLYLARTGWQATLRQASAEAAAIGARLEAAVFLTGGPGELRGQLAALTEELAAAKPSIAAWLVYHEAELTTSAATIVLARAALAVYDATIPLGGGTNIYFTHLNRERPPAAGLDLVCYSVNPQVHAFDNDSLMETLAGQAATVTSARAFCGATPIAVTPITLRPRFNADAAGPEPPPAPGDLPAAVDQRQPSLFAAAWLVGSLQQLAAACAASVTYFETTGWRGVMETAAGSALPGQFHSQPGALFPVYHVLTAAGAFAGGQALTVTTGVPLRVAALALRNGDRVCLLVANLTSQSQRVAVQFPPLGTAARVRHLDETTAEAAMHDPAAFHPGGAQLAAHEGQFTLDLKPFAVVRLDAGPVYAAAIGAERISQS
jgi:D-apionolactonase